jgi:SET domain-containing protein
MTALSLNYEQITRNVIVDGNDDSPYYDGSISLCNCHNHPPPQTCTTEICFNYATLTECLQCSSTHCQNNKFTQLYSKKLEVRPVEHKGHGLFCLEDIERGGDFIREYVGELITTKEFVKRFFLHPPLPSLPHLRSRRMKAPDISTHLYIMELKPNTFLDARRKGSVSRFINHSCEPNCTVEVWTVGKRLRVGIFSLKAIPAGSELTFDYRWERSVRPPTKYEHHPLPLPPSPLVGVIVEPNLVAVILKSTRKVMSMNLNLLLLSRKLVCQFLKWMHIVQH